MTFRELEIVVLERDIPERGLRKGDLGAVVELYDPDGLEVEPGQAPGRGRGPGREPDLKGSFNTAQLHWQVVSPKHRKTRFFWRSRANLFALRCGIAQLAPHDPSG